MEAEHEEDEQLTDGVDGSGQRGIPDRVQHTHTHTHSECVWEPKRRKDNSMSVMGRDGGEGQDQTDTLTGSSEEEKRCFQMQARARFLCGERSCHQEGEPALRSAATFSLSCPDAQICLRQTAVRCQSVSLGLWEDSLTLLLRPASGGGQLYRKSSSSAWCRDTRSPWAEIRQKGMLC